MHATTHHGGRHDLTFLTTRTIQRMIQAENRQLWEVISSEKHQKPEELLPASKHSETQGAHPVQLRGQKNVRVHSSKVRTHPFASLGTQEQVLSYPHPVGKSFNKRRSKVSKWSLQLRCVREEPTLGAACTAVNATRATERM